MAEPLGIALGSNMGNRIEHLRAAVEGILSFCGERSVETSSVYETEPIGCPPDSEKFFNAVVEVKCSLEPLEVLNKCQAIEKKLGRQMDGEENAPRPIDLDILYYGDFEVKEDDLVIPHPSLTERKFVLEPLSEIRPGLILPGETSSIEELLAEKTFVDSEFPMEKIYERGFWL